ncbi:MAG: hypothetical protein UY30_C0010G0003 [Parcubacteria group bacterium GW2011_GWB1_48_6]|nr:MAG: hypothetical protein UY30_C0010G0003 [Parcubacteria group bacterium GW2011_GWB1_48_6]
MIAYLKSHALLRAGLLLAFFNLLSRVVGLVRDRILVGRFGAGDVLDVYYLAFNLPDFIFNLLVAGALAAAFIPVFIEYKEKQQPGEEWRLASNFLNFLFVAVAVVGAVMFFLAPWLIALIAPGFSLAKQADAVLFTRVMLLSPLIFAVSGVVGSILQAFNRFLAFALAPTIYNLGIIFGALVLVPQFGPIGLAYGVVVGALAHLLVQWGAALRLGFAWRPIFTLADNGLRRIFKLMIPRTLGLVAGQVNLIVLNALATTVGVGSVALLTIANNFQYLPIALVGISAAVAAFPTLSRDALQQDRSIFIRRLNYILKRLLWLIIPASIVFYLLVDWILRILLQTGYFQAADVTILGQVLRMFILGIWAQTLIPTLARAFYALQNTITPVVISIASIAVNIGLAYYFVSVLGWELSGLGLAFSMAGILNVALLWIFLWRKLRQS